MKCPNCNAEVSGKYCEYCGSELPQEKPKVGGCPRCGSENVSFHRERVTTATQRSSSRAMFSSRRTGRSVSQTEYNTVGVCQSCGYTWNPNPTTNNQSTGSKLWLWILGWLFIFPVPLTILMLRKKDMKPSVKYGIIIAAWLLFFIIGIFGGTEETSPTDAPAPTAIVQTEQTTPTDTP